MESRKLLITGTLLGQGQELSKWPFRNMNGLHKTLIQEEMYSADHRRGIHIYEIQSIKDMLPGIHNGAALKSKWMVPKSELT